jgi:hypothetical protein
MSKPILVIPEIVLGTEQATSVAQAYLDEEPPRARLDRIEKQTLLAHDRRA